MTDNAIVIENRKPGTPQNVWDAPASNQIEGFATQMSVDNGAAVSFKINLNVASNASAPFHIEIYRLGYYGGDGATLVTTLSGLTGHAQPNPITDARGLVDAGNWSVSASWTTPADATSGVYLAKLVRDDNGATNQIPFIVRDDASTSDIVLQTDDTTWEAYNGWAGRNGQVGGSLYGGFTQPAGLSADPSSLDYDRAFAVSYNRPFITRDDGGHYAGPQDYLFGEDYAAISFLEKNGYDVSYISGVDTDRMNAASLEQHKAFISVGHDEYWSGDQRANVEAARDAGVNLLFWSGNEVYWKTRWEGSIVDGVDHRTLVSYKETKFNNDPNATAQDYPNVDPSNQWTGTWRDTRFVDAVAADGVTHTAVGARPENSLTGQLFSPDGTGEFGGAISVPAGDAALRYWRDTGIGPQGATGIAPGIIGYEWDTVPLDANRPAGEITLSSSTLAWSDIVTDQGNHEAPGTATHSLSLYRAPSGALVFGAGTVFWSWGLSDEHDSGPYAATIANKALQQFSVNLFADMGIQPGATDAQLQAEGLVRASASNDHVAATATLDALPINLSVGAPVVLTGTASDNDGDPATSDGKVALVEVSVDGGQTWSVAQGTSAWSYSWTPSAAGGYLVEARAMDDSLNLPAGAHIATQSATVTAPTGSSLFSAITPNGQVFSDGRSVELGMKFEATSSGAVAALRYFRASADAGDTDVRQGHLWTSTGSLLGTVTFTSAPGQSGWQQASLSTPVTLQVGVTYVVSYNTADNYVATNNYFTSTVVDPTGRLDAPSSAAAGGNGVYAYGASGLFPNQSFSAANYWVDVVFSPTVASVTTPSGLALEAASDSGAAGDGVTNHAAVIVDGLADAGAAVTLYDASVVVGTGVANASGVFQISTTSLTDGAHGLAAKATLGALTSPFSAALSVNIDTHAPAAPTSLADAAAVNGAVDDGHNTAAQTLTGLAEASATVTVYDNAVRLGTTVASSAGQWTYGLGRLGGGAHSFTAAASDLAGNLGPPSPALSLSVSGPPAPPSTPDLLAASDSGLLSNDNLTSNRTPTVVGTAVPAGLVTLYDGATVVGSTTADAGGAWSIVTAPLADGSHLLSATDATADGASAASGTLTVVVDTTAPAASTAPDLAAASDDGASSSDNITSVLTPSFSGTVVGETAGTVTLYEGGLALGAASISAAGAWSVTSTSLSLGSHVITARATDAAGNLGALSAPLSVSIVAPPPTYSLFAPAVIPGGVLYNDSQPVELGVKFQAADSGTITALRYFRGAADATDIDTRAGHLWSANGTLLGTVTFTSAVGAAGWQTATLATPISVQAGVTYIVSYHTADNYLAAGSYFTPAVSGPGNELTALSNAAAGGNGVYAYGAGSVAPTQSFGASNYWADVVFTPGPPATPSTPDLLATSDTGVSATDNLTSDNTPTLAGTAAAGATVTLSEGAAALGSVTADASGQWSITTATLADGLHLLTATSATTSGVSAPSSGLSVTVDSTAPTAPSVPDLAAASDDGASSSDNITGISTPTFVGTAAGEAGGTVTLLEGATVLGSSVINSSGGWSVSSSVLSLGAHAISARTTDAAGNVGGASDALAITILPGPPPAPSAPDLLAASDSGTSTTDNRTNDKTPTLVGTAVAGSTVQLFDSATLVGSVTADGGGAWSITSTVLGDGVHTLTAKDVTTGGTSPASAALTVTVDTAAPAASTPDMSSASDNGSSNSDNSTSITTPIFTGTLPGETGARVSLFDGATALGAATVDAAGSWSITSAGLALGAHTITAQATDVAGNVGLLSAGLPVVIVAGGQTLTGTAAANTLTGGAGDDSLSGVGGDDQLLGANGNDTLNGGAGNDAINGGAGSDLLIGGAGADSLTGGAGDDIFRFTALTDSSTTRRDLIMDFQGAGVAGGDLIDVSAIAGAFVFNGTGAFSGGGVASLRYVISGGVTDLLFDSGDGGAAEMDIRINAATTFTSGDFIL